MPPSTAAAGMRVAYEVLRCVELLGGQPTGPDYEALVAGVVAESNADVALELSERCAQVSTYNTGEPAECDWQPAAYTYAFVICIVSSLRSACVPEACSRWMRLFN
jgi:hypothetical protein